MFFATFIISYHFFSCYHYCELFICFICLYFILFFQYKLLLVLFTL